MAKLRVLAVMLAAVAAALMIVGVLVWSPGTTAAVGKPISPNGPVTTLPLDLEVGDATQVITVVAASLDAATAQLQPWTRVQGGWMRVGPSVTAHVASGGLTATPREFDPATPLGSFTLSQAFGKLPNPGTRLPFFQVTSADWWISQAGPLYNTHQFCSLSCSFVQGSPNARLNAQVRAYNYAVVIDYNRNPVTQGAGSAYFLHVTTAGKPTNGCIAVDQPALASILRWLEPSANPRILIGLS